MSYYTRLITFVSGGKLPASDLNAEFDAVKTGIDAIEADIDAAALTVTTAGSNTTSTTSNSIGTGSKTWTVETGKSLVVGMFYRMASTASPTTFAAGTVTAYNSSTGSLTLNVTVTSGSGTITAWTGSLTVAIVGGTMVRRAVTSTDTVIAGDNGGLIDITSGTFTLAYTAAATLGSGFWCVIRNSGTGDVTHDPASSETIDGLTSFVMYPGEARLIQCDGSAFRSVVISTGVKATSGSLTLYGPCRVQASPTGHSYALTLPDARGIQVGNQCVVVDNQSGYDYAIKDNAGTLLGFAPPMSEVTIALTANTTQAGVWALTGDWSPVGATLGNSTSLSVGGASYAASVIKCVPLDSTRDMLLLTSGAGLYACVVDRSTNTFGTPVLVRTGVAFAANQISGLLIGTDKVLVASGYTSSYYLQFVVVTASGTTASVGTANTTSTHYIHSMCDLVASGTSYFLAYNDDNSGSPLGKAVGITESGGTVTTGSVVNLSAALANSGTGGKSYLISAGQFLVVGVLSGAAYQTPVSISGSTCTTGTGGGALSNAASNTCHRQVANGRVLVLGVDSGPTNRYAYLVSVSANASSSSNVNLGTAGTASNFVLAVNSNTAIAAWYGKANVLDCSTATISQGTAVDQPYTTTPGFAGYDATTLYLADNTNGTLWNVAVSGANPVRTVTRRGFFVGAHEYGGNFTDGGTVPYNMLKGTTYVANIPTAAVSTGMAYRDGKLIRLKAHNGIPLVSTSTSHNLTSRMWFAYGNYPGSTFLFHVECA